MRLRRDKRGQIRVIEAFFASVLMLSSLALIPVAVNHNSDSTDVLSSRALNVLASLDSDGHLANLVDERNWTAIQSCIEAVLPAAIWFNFSVYDENLTPLNSVLITTGSAISSKIDAADYLCVSTNATYQIYMLRLQLGGLD